MVKDESGEGSHDVNSPLQHHSAPSVFPLIFNHLTPFCLIFLSPRTMLKLHNGWGWVISICTIKEKDETRWKDRSGRRNLKGTGDGSPSLV